jgi:tRNA (Thr-GGU) A37 N-methylase
VKPFLDDKLHGIFANRSYRWPDPICLSVVRLIKRTSLILKNQNVDMLDETPLFDIKPYVSEFNVHTVDKLDWYATRPHH